ncbi:hypothetical protein H9636_14250 [Ureibacillus sp. Re31]|uniref:NERD domain-containing protein n=1 Tax=Ureibacillus galli TaxID=2762222 RepID=A0ABR8XF20_9BACL|nr:hypothetical protein [Ureibacillus galli]MBD8027811.1 hypothetical protein [Ureibacillus galli]
MAEQIESGVYLQEHFRDSLIIDRYDPQLERLRKRKQEQLSNQYSEDAIVWNVFRTFNQIDRSLWIEPLFQTSFHINFPYSIDAIKIHFWKRIRPPKSYPLLEEQSEIDIIIESDEFVWFLEAKYKSDILFNTTQHRKRDEILRHIDVGTNYARKKDFYFSLIIMDKYSSPYGYRMTTEYRDSIEGIIGLLPHRKNLANLKGINVFTWKEVQSLFKTVYLYSKNKYEKFIADQASYWLLEKLNDER